MTVCSNTPRRIRLAVALLAVCVACGLGTTPGQTACADVVVSQRGLADVGAGTSARIGSGGPSPLGVPARIRDIQGRAHVSALAGQQVADVSGVVTAVASNRFFMQDPKPDVDPATSDALVVFTGSAPHVAVGDAVTVAGIVEEFRPGDPGATNLATTQISSPTVVVASSGNALPAATLVGPGGRSVPAAVIDDDATGSVETSGSFDPRTTGSTSGSRWRLCAYRSTIPRSSARRTRSVTLRSSRPAPSRGRSAAGS
jgi:hypothetical protein